MGILIFKTNSITIHSSYSEFFNQRKTFVLVFVHAGRHSIYEIWWQSKLEKILSIESEKYDGNRMYGWYFRPKSMLLTIVAREKLSSRYSFNFLAIFQYISGENTRKHQQQWNGAMEFLYVKMDKRLSALQNEFNCSFHSSNCHCNGHL